MTRAVASAIGILIAAFSAERATALELHCVGSGTVTQYMGLQEVDARALSEMDFYYTLDVGLETLSEQEGVIYSCSINENEFACSHAVERTYYDKVIDAEMVDVLAFEVLINRKSGRYTNITQQTTYRRNVPQVPANQLSADLYKVFGSCERDDTGRRF